MIDVINHGEHLGGLKHTEAADFRYYRQHILHKSGRTRDFKFDFYLICLYSFDNRRINDV